MWTTLTPQPPSTGATSAAAPAATSAAPVLSASAANNTNLVAADVLDCAGAAVAGPCNGGLSLESSVNNAISQVSLLLYHLKVYRKKILVQLGELYSKTIGISFFFGVLICIF